MPFFVSSEMLNGEINEFSVTQELTQVASYFAIVDNAIKASDTNKKYKISTNNCEAAPTPFKLGSWCSIPISPQGQNMVDLYNSFITVTLDLGEFIDTSAVKALFPALPTYTISGTTHNIGEKGFKEPGVWIGFKDAMDIVDQYQLVANGQAFYSQSFAIEESYITGLATTEQVKAVDPYSKIRHEDVWNGDEKCGTGTMMTHSTLEQNTNNIITLKIDLRRFLPLATIKYLPEFVGNLELRLHFSINALVCAPTGFDGVAGCPANVGKLSIGNASGYTGHGITNKFVPYEELKAGHVIGITAMDYTPKAEVSASGSSSIYVPSQVGIVCGPITGAGLKDTPRITECKSHLACFGLDINIYNQLAARYEQTALSFPIQTLTFHQMNGRIDHSKWTSGGGQASVSATAVPRFVDSIFFLFPLDANHRTCYDNILSTDYQLKMGGYGTFPEVTYSSWSPEFLEVSANVFNVNNDLTGFNKDVVRSLIQNGYNQTGFTSFDTSNFVLSVPTSTDNTFQQGQTSNTTINYQLQLKLAPESPILSSASSCVPMIGFLKDSVLAIQRRPGGAPPIITLDEYDITTPAQ